MELIGLKGITFAYAGLPPVLRELDFSLNSGDRVGIWGPNGAGKSTLFQVAMGLLPAQAGQVMGLGQPCSKEKDFRALRKAVGYLFQDPDDQLFCPTVGEDVAFGPRNLGLGQEQARQAALTTLADLGMAGYERRLTYQLSGGEKRLAALAGVLAMRPQAILLDEPANGLDEGHAARLESLLMESDLAWALVSHDRGLLERICGKILRMEGGRLRLEE